MNKPPGLLERLSPRPVVCPLINLGRSSPTSAKASSQNEHLYYRQHPVSYHNKYDIYEHTNSDRVYQEKQLSLEANKARYIQQNYHEPRSFLSNDVPDYRSKYDNISNEEHAGTFSKQNGLELSSLSLGASYWEHDNYNISDSGTEYFRSSSQTHETNYLLDSFAKLGKSSPNLDQGYHTLVSPSPGPITSNTWNEDNLYKGKKYQIRNNSFDRLTDDLIIRIFSFLRSTDLSCCAKVCRRFDSLVWTPSLWRTIQLEGDHVSGDRAIRGILRQLCGQGRTGVCSNVERVHLTDGAKLTDKGLSLLARRCPELTHVQIHGSTAVTNGALFELATRCANLQHLDVTGK